MKNIVIGTGCYQNVKSGNTVSVTGDGGNAWGYYGPAYKKFSPSWKLYTTWRDNPENLTQEELIDYYIKEYFNHRLANLNLNDLFYELEEKFGDEIIFLCHELPGDFCHRRLDADFIEILTGFHIPEIRTDENGKITRYFQPDYKPKLKLFMK